MRSAKRLAIHVLSATISLVAGVHHAAGADGRPGAPIPPDHYTKAELTGFRSRPSYDETVAFLLRLTATSPHLHIDWFGTSGMGRRMPVVIVSRERAFTPDDSWKRAKPVVLVLNSIHGGECDGTDASLILLRNIALGHFPEILDGVTLLVVPIYNVDGYEHFGKYNRPNQNGPAEGMGFRTNARGLDLNRDFLKVDAPETRALVSLANAWRPDLFVDDHVTDGADFVPTLTLAYGNEPVTAKPLADWLRKVVPRALAGVEDAGYKTAPYVDFVDPLDPLKGIDPGVIQPRFSTGYFPLRSVPSILVETHSIKPYADRVRANEKFLTALLTLTASEAKPLAEVREKARQEARRAAVGSLQILDAETDRTRGEDIDLPGYAYTQVISPVSGKPVLRYDRSKPVTLRLPVYPHVKPKLQVPRPAAYVVPAGWPSIEERLKAHGIKFQKLEKPLTLKVGTYRASEPGFAKDTYQGRTRVTARIKRGVETRDVPAGSLYVPLDTELAPVALALLEPEGPDSLLAWGELSSIFELKEYIDQRNLDPLAEEMLKKDAKLAAEWNEKLKDPAFAADARARWRFFFERTPYWDETVGLVPVYRLEAPLEFPPTPAGASAASPR